MRVHVYSSNVTHIANTRTHTQTHASPDVVLEPFPQSVAQALPRSHQPTSVWINTQGGGRGVCFGLIEYYREACGIWFPACNLGLHGHTHVCTL